MPTRDADQHGVGDAVKDVSDHAKRLVELKVELAALEMKHKAGALGLGVALLAVAAVFGLFALGFLLATAAAALALELETWLALLIVGVVLLVLAGVLALVGRGRVKRGTPPVPEQAIRETKRTKEALTSDGGV